MSDPRRQDFLDRLWQIQAAAGMNDAALAREIGVAQSSISRARNDPARTFGIDFALRACDRFPELRFILFGDFPVRHNDAPMGKAEGAA